MLYHLMMNLFHPAAVGACFVVLFQRVVRDPVAALFDCRTWFTVYLVAYFSFFHWLAVELEHINPYDFSWSSGDYGWAMFSIDLVEILVLIFATGLLGLEDERGLAGRLGGPRSKRYWLVFCCALAILPAFQFAWYRVARIPTAHIPYLFYLAVVILGVNFIWRASRIVWQHWFFCLAHAIVSAYHYFSLPIISSGGH